jgi:hypothetical protein
MVHVVACNSSESVNDFWQVSLRLNIRDRVVNMLQTSSIAGLEENTAK